MATVRLENVTKKFGEFTALQDITVHIDDREFMVLLGPSGSGKTTTLRLIAGLDTPTAGRIFIDDEIVNDLPPKDRDVAMVFQNYALYPHLTAEENIAVPLRLRRLSKAKIKEEVRRAGDLLQIRHVLHKKPRHLSGGEQQRVALGRAIVRNPKVFLFDEPLSNLDAKLRVTTRGFLKRLQRQLGVTTIYVTHDQAEALTMADRIAVFNGGVVQQVSPPHVLYNDPANLFVAGFVGSPPMNFIRGRVIESDGGILFDGGNLQIPLPSAAQRLAGLAGSPSNMVLGVRSEDVVLSPVGQEGWNRGKVYVVEPLGSVQYVTVDFDGQRLTAQAAASASFQIDQELYCRFGEDKLYIFDPTSGERLA